MNAVSVRLARHILRAFPIAIGREWHGVVYLNEVIIGSRALRCAGFFLWFELVTLLYIQHYIKMKNLIFLLLFLTSSNIFPQCDYMICGLDCDDTYLSAIPYFNFTSQITTEFVQDDKVKIIINHRQLLDTISPFKGRFWKDPKELFFMRNHLSYNEYYTYDENNVLVDHKFYPSNCTLNKEDSIGVNCWKIEKIKEGKKTIYKYYELGKLIEKKTFVGKKIINSIDEFSECYYEYDKQGKLIEEKTECVTRKYTYYKDSTVIDHFCYLKEDGINRHYKACVLFDRKGNIYKEVLTDCSFPDFQIVYNISYDEKGVFVSNISKIEYGGEPVNVLKVFYKFFHKVGETSTSNFTSMGSAVYDGYNTYFFTFYKDGKVKSVERKDYYKSEFEYIYR